MLENGPSQGGIGRDLLGVVHHIEEAPVQRQDELFAPGHAPVIGRNPNSGRIGQRRDVNGAFIPSPGQSGSHLHVSGAAPDADHGDLGLVQGDVVDFSVEVVKVRIRENHRLMRSRQSDDGIHFGTVESGSVVDKQGLGH